MSLLIHRPVKCVHSPQTQYFLLFYLLSSVSCGAPPSISHASSILTKQGNAFVATYTCDSGYDLSNAQMNKKQCAADANAWSIVNVECITQGEQSSILNG